MRSATELVLGGAGCAGAGGGVPPDHEVGSKSERTCETGTKESDAPWAPLVFVQRTVMCLAPPAPSAQTHSSGITGSSSDACPLWANPRRLPIADIEEGEGAEENCHAQHVQHL